MKTLTISIQLILMLLCIGETNAQKAPRVPANFDWRIRVDITETREVLYDRDVLQEVPENAMFWVDIQPKTSRSRRFTYAKDGKSIYERTRVFERTVNGEPFNHGFSKMVKAQGKVMYTLTSNPNKFILDTNSSLFEYNQDVADLVNESFDLSELENRLYSNGWLRIFREGKTWYRSTDSELAIEMSIDASNNIIRTNYLENGSSEYVQFREVEANIWQLAQVISTTPFQNAEGYCLENRVTITYDNYNIINNEDNSQLRITNEPVSTEKSSKIYQVDGGVKVDLMDNYEHPFDIKVYDVSGRLIHSEFQTNQDIIYFDAPMTGLYFIEIMQNGEYQVSKIFLN